MLVHVKTNFVEMTWERLITPKAISCQDVQLNDIIAAGTNKNDVRMGTAEVVGDSIVVSLLNDLEQLRTFPLDTVKTFLLGRVLESKKVHWDKTLPLSCEMTLAESKSER